MLNLYDEDSCCGPALSAALFDGSLDEADTWVHEECGQTWRVTQLADGTRHWSPECPVLVFGNQT